MIRVKHGSQYSDPLLRTTGGTRFARFPGPGEPQTVFEKIEDCETVFGLVRATPGVSLHIPWDRPEHPAELRAFAESRGLYIDSTNSNTFQDQPGQRYSYKFGSLSHTDRAVRQQAVEHNLECLALGAALGARAHTVWIGDGANFPGQIHLRRALDRYLESMRQIYAALPDGCRLFLEHKLYEPAFYATVLSDWGTSYVCSRELGDRACALVDLGHHAPNVSIEQIVARLIQLGKLAGFHFNDSKNGDDDLDAGSIKPFELFLIFNELVDAALEGVAGFDPAYMLDQSHNVTITNKAMGTSVSVVTNDAGFFQAPYLIPGLYQVSVELSGFKKYVRDGIELGVGDRLELDVTLEIGRAEETVTVTAGTRLLETTSGSLGTVVDARRVAELPTPHGDPYALIGLAGGVAYTGSIRLDRPFEPTHIVGYAIDGTRGNRSDLTIDGVPNTATANPGEVIASYVPPADIVHEFKVQTATFDASLGNTEGGVTNLSIKSGANVLHGTAYFVKTPKPLFANDFFANANNIPLADFTYNRYGGSVGGPVQLPGYNGRGKTFFMYGFEGIHEARPRNNGTPTVPTDKMRNGDFSELLALGPQYQLYNPFTRRTVAGGRIQADPFPGNIIDPRLINPVAKAVLDYIPHALTAGGADGSNNFQQPSLPETIKYASNTIRVDHNISDKQRMYGRFSWYDRNSDYNNYFDNLSTGEWFTFVSRQVAFDHVYVVNPTTVLNLRYGYNRFVRGTDTNPANHGFDLTKLGFPASYNAVIPEEIRRFPRFDFISTGTTANYQGTGFGGEYRPNQTNSFIATVSKSMGAHSLRTGMELRRYRQTSRFFGNNLTGQFKFDSTWTRGPLDNSPIAPNGVGQTFAAFLLGLPASGTVTRAASYDEASSTWGFYVQDDWRLGSRLTLNLGLRYEYETALVEAGNRSVRGFDAAVDQAIDPAARAALDTAATGISLDRFHVRGGLTFAGVNGQPNALYETPKNNWMPRVGAAYKLNVRTVLRAGYGLFYGFLGQRRGDVITTGFSSTSDMALSLNNGLTFIETLSNPFQGGIQEPLGAAQGTGTFLGQSITFFDPNPKSPRMQRWQVGVDRELPGRWVAGASYVGNHGAQLQTSRNINATPLLYLSKSSVRDQATIDYLSALVPNPFFGLMPQTAGINFRSSMIARERLLRPYPQFDAVNTTTNEGWSSYHALQTSLQKRFSGGYTIGASYTFSRFTEATEFLNPADSMPWEGISSQDVPHRLTVSGIWELPFGGGRRFAADAARALDTIIGGWQVQGIYTYQSGFPVGNFGNLLFTGSFGDIALPADQRRLQRWFNTDAGFNAVSAQQLASNVRTFPLRFDAVRTGNVSNVDLSVIKNATLMNTKTLQFRFEAINAFNRPLFPGPAGNSLNPTSFQFGQIVTSAQQNYPRRIQVMLKIMF